MSNERPSSTASSNISVDLSDDAVRQWVTYESSWESLKSQFSSFEIEELRLLCPSAVESIESLTQEVKSLANICTDLPYEVPAQPLGSPMAGRILRPGQAQSGIVRSRLQAALTAASAATGTPPFDLCVTTSERSWALFALSGTGSDLSPRTTASHSDVARFARIALGRGGMPTSSVEGARRPPLMPQDRGALFVAAIEAEAQDLRRIDSALRAAIDARISGRTRSEALWGSNA